MEVIPDSCRLCLDPFAENTSSINDPRLKEQMEKVFYFPISHLEGYSTIVCQSCSYTISEFYKFSETVRLNQEQLETRVPGEASIETKVAIEEVKVEPVDPRHGSECIELTPDTIKLEKEFEEESDDSSDFEILVVRNKSPIQKPRKKRKKETQPRRKRTSKSAQHGNNDGDEERVKKKHDVKSKEELEQEDKLILEFYRMVCDLCGEHAPNFSSLDNHFRENHGRRGYVVCCKKKLPKRCFLLQHMTLHTNPNAFRCELCNKSYKNKVYLSLHQIKIHGSEEDRPFKCDRCTQSFAKEYMLRGHLANHEKIQCPQCDRLLASKAALSVHLTNMHSGVDRRMICDSCGQEFLNKTCFERHVKEHMGIEVVKKLQCHICQKWLMGERGLQKHLQFTHYEKEKTHVCDICQQHYPNSRALSSHKRIVHIVEKFECEFCGKKFKRAVNLKEHRTIHTGEVLYSCDVCGVTMNSKANLYTHTKKNHPMEWTERKLKAAEANIPKTQA